MRQKLIGIVIAVVISFMVNIPRSHGEQVERQIEVEAPNISFMDASGNVKSLEDFKGRTVVLSFWATWCGPCLIELPAMDRLQKKMGSKVLILPIGLEAKGASIIERFYAKAGIQHLPIYVDQERLSQSIYQLRALPMAFIVNRKGMIVGKVEGAMDWDTKKIQEYLENL